MFSCSGKNVSFWSQIQWWSFFLCWCNGLRSTASAIWNRCIDATSNTEKRLFLAHFNEKKGDHLSCQEVCVCLMIDGSLYSRSTCTWFPSKEKLCLDLQIFRGIHCNPAALMFLSRTTFALHFIHCCIDICLPVLWPRTRQQLLYQDPKSAVPVLITKQMSCYWLIESVGRTCVGNVLNPVLKKTETTNVLENLFS